jgi:CO/xanthine dehydrogenase Mo-binding subunit
MSADDGRAVRPAPPTGGAVGADLRDIDGESKVTGGARYTSDFTIPGMLHARILRSPHPHARIVAIDVAAALAMEGVVAVATGEDVRALDHHYGEFIRDQPILAVDKVRYAGEPVAAVAAVNEAIAWRAVEAIRVTYDVLPALDTMAAALADDAPPLFDARPHGADLPPAPPHGRWTQEPSPNVLYQYDYAVGDVDAVFASAPHVFEDRFTFGRLSHYALEPHACVATAPTPERIELWSNNQDAFLLQRDLARMFALAPEHVRLHTGLVGGGFGSKSYCKTEPIAVVLARKTGRPVRLALTLAESMLTVCEHAAELRVKSAVGTDGTLLARESDILLDGGAYADASPSVATRVGARMAGPYVWQALRTRVRVIRTSTVPAGSFRGFGAGHVTWASESQIDMIARRLALDPVALRRRHFLRPGQPGSPGEGPLDSDLAAALDALLSQAAVDPARRVPGRGVGIAVAVKGSSGKYHRGDASVTIEATGRIVLGAGVTEIGQATRTALVQIAAGELAVDPAAVVIDAIDTAATPFNAGTYASTGISVTGLAVRDAAARAREALLDFAADALGVPVATLAYRAGRVMQGEAAYTLAELAARVDRSPATLAFTGTASSVGNSGWMPVLTLAEVDVDVETGLCKVTGLTSVVDAGCAIHPARCVTQVEGAAVQGLGQALFEELQCLDGQPVNATPLGYRVPRTRDVPTRFQTVILEQGGGPGPWGAKGIGETGNLTVPAAIANAIADATGARVTDLPITPERVLRALAG